MHNNVKAFLATTALFFSCQVLANGGCGFEEQQQGLIATCSEEKQEVILTGIIEAQHLVTELNEFSKVGFIGTYGCGCIGTIDFLNRLC